MPSKERFPILVKVQSVTVKIYRVNMATTADGYAYTIAWVGPNGREKVTRADLKTAKDEAQAKAQQLVKGLTEGTLISRSDVMELTESRRFAAEGGLPVLSALAEWAKARTLTDGHVIEAAQQWAQGHMSTLVRITVPKAVTAFIEDKNAAGKEGDRVYKAKLKPAADFFPDRMLDTISTRDWTRYLATFADPVTRNDHRKRAVTLCRWAQRNSHLAEDVKPEIEKTERAKERARPIGILTSGVYHQILAFIRKHHPHYLAATVITGLCGVRAEEVHGKQRDPELRQDWKDIHLDRGFMSVTAAKENTPSNRIIHLSPAAIAWLKVCPKPHEGPVCAINALARVRDICQTADRFVLPENCFRHSWITYRIALTGDKASTATEAGNSVKEIDRRYRVPKPKEEGEAWFATRP